ncbi:MAG: hypothetical protein HPY76_10895 [Anaerolineae bacterium]|nr:hypothetical protein [Anaerolineae bacterium]
MTPEKLDLRKQYKHLYQPSAKTVSLVDVPPFKYIMIDGQIEPGKTPSDSPGFQDVMQALYGIAFTIKFNSKLRKENPLDFTVMPLEALWWVDEGEFDMAHPENWRWCGMIMQPDHIDQAMYQDGMAQMNKKKPSPALERVRFETFAEGLCMQVMHIGPYSAEAATVARMNEFARENGYVHNGKHHEIYLGDPRRTDPAKLKTVLRQPLRKG